MAIATRSTLAAVGLTWVFLWSSSFQATTNGQEPAPVQAEDKGAEPKQQSTDEKRREALLLLGQAELAAAQGHYDQALELAKKAQQLYPESLSIRAFIESVQEKATGGRRLPEVLLRAKAHLGAALSRAQDLMRQRRYTEAVDLLEGVLRAAELFPPEAKVDFYREVAEKELARYKEAVQRGEIRPRTPPKREEKESTEEAPGSVPSLRIADVPPGPKNAYRLVRIAAEAAPDWYLKTKTILQRKMTVDYRNMPLGLVLEDVRKATGLNIIIDDPVRASRATGLALVDFRAKGVSAETVLSVACEVAGCEYVLLPQGIVVTTKDKAADYVRSLPDAVAENWARGRYLFPELYVDAAKQLPLPEASPEEVARAREKEDIPPYLRSGEALVSHIQRLLR